MTKNSETEISRCFWAMDWAVARAAGFERGTGAGLGLGAGDEDSTVVLLVLFLPPAFPRRAAGAGGGSANSSSCGGLTRWPAFARDRVPLRGFARAPFAEVFRVPARAFTLPFAVFLRAAFAKGSFLLANSAV